MKYIIRDLTLDDKTWECYLNEKEIKLTYKEFDLLKMLMINSPAVVTRSEILNSWEDGKEYCLNTNIVEVYIYYLKNKIPGYIESVRRVGYKIK